MQFDLLKCFTQWLLGFISGSLGVLNIKTLKLSFQKPRVDNLRKPNYSRTLISQRPPRYAGLVISQQLEKAIPLSCSSSLKVQSKYFLLKICSAWENKIKFTYCSCMLLKTPCMVHFSDCVVKHWYKDEGLVYPVVWIHTNSLRYRVRSFSLAGQYVGS